MQENSPPPQTKIVLKPIKGTKIKIVNPGFVPPPPAELEQDRLRAVPQTFDGEMIRSPARRLAPPPAPAQSRRTLLVRKPAAPLTAFKQQEKEEETRDPYVLKEDTLTAFASPTRRGFGQYILDTFKPFTLMPKFGKEDVDACKKLAAAGESDRVETFLYQQFVREYLRAATPYRGLLVYHGLGSGKTCSAIAAAEALFGTANKKIIVMTPFSLRGNFQAQISFCGFRHYRINNHWTFLDLEDKTVSLYAAEVLHIPQKFMDSILYRKEKERRGVWVPDFNLPANYKDLTSQQQSDIRAQITAIIENRITFINYNGITPNKLKEIACHKPDFFDNAVIVIDEIHNITRLMQGNLEKYMKPRKSRKVGSGIPPEPVTVDRWSPFLCGLGLNYNRAFLMYKLLVGAKNSKIIGLSGTPLINFPDELGILMNIIAGYIHCCSVNIPLTDDASIAAIRARFNAHPRVDMVRTRIGQATTQFFFSIFQEGYTKNKENTGLVEDDAAAQTIKDIWTELSAGDKVLAGLVPTYSAEPRFPVEEETFQNIFLNRSTLGVKNENVLMKRMHGLVSYYRGSSEDLMPKIIEDTIVNVPFTPYSLGVYIKKRLEEIVIEREQAKKEKKKGKQEVGAFDDVKKVASTANYRFNSRAACNFCFPKTIERPSLRDPRKTLGEMEDARVTDAAPITDAAYSIEDAAADAAAAAEVAAEEAAVAAAEVADNVQVGSGPEDSNEDSNEGSNEGSNDSSNDDSNESNEGSNISYTEEELAELPPEIAEVYRQYKSRANVDSNTDSNESNTESNDSYNSNRSYTEEEIAELPPEIAAVYKEYKAKPVEPVEPVEPAPIVRTVKPIKTVPVRPPTQLLSYEEELLLALRNLRSQAKQLLSLDGPEDSRLDTFSPKYAEVLRRVLATPGSSLLYSQFKSAEGLGIFGFALEANGWTRIEIQGTSFSQRTIESLKKGPAAENRFLFFTGEGSLEERKILLNIFNARINELPPPMQLVLKEAGFTQNTGNLAGELCRLIGITGAGAEGISLKAVRAVHILEPYWNNVRTDQVKGRAVRICSHADLPPEDRNVSVYTYCSIFSQEDIKGRRVDETIMIQDEGITSDEHVLKISQKKAKINEDFLRVLKQSAVDCILNSGENNEAIACYKGVQGPATDSAFDPDMTVDLQRSVLEERATGAPVTVAAPIRRVGAPVTAVAAAAPVAAPAAQLIKKPATTIAGKQYWMDRKKGVTEIYTLYDLLDRTGQTPMGEVEKNPITGKFRVKLF
jgi:hypothetical protein